MSVSSRFSAALDAVRRSEELAKLLFGLNFGDSMNADALADNLEWQAKRLRKAAVHMDKAARLARQAGKK